MASPLRSSSLKCAQVAQCGTRLELAISTRGASACVGNTPTGLPDCTSKVSSSVRLFSVSTMRSKQFQSRAARPMPPYTTSSAGFSATSGSKLFISMRSGASVIQVRALKVLPRAARMTLGFNGASMVTSLGAETPRHFIAGTGVIEPGHRGDLAGSPCASNHQQARLIALHGQELARAFIRHHRTQQVFGFLQRSDFDQVVVRRGLIEIHFQIVGRELGQNVAAFELNGTIVLEVQ